MNFIDKIISYFSPEKGLERTLARQKMAFLDTYAEHGASRSKKSLASWYTPQLSADEDITDNLDILRARSRDLYMGNPIATGALKTIRTNTVGAGLRVSSVLSPNADLLKMSEEEANKKEREIEREFSIWAENCDYTGVLSWGEMQSLALLSALMSGDCFALLINEKDRRSPYSLKIKLLEGDYVCDPNPKPSDKNILQGVEVDDKGKTVAFWVASRHPNSFYRTTNTELTKWQRIEVYGKRSGRRNILHIRSDYERPGQRRGLPLLSPVIEHLKQLTRYTEAELAAAVVSGMFTVFVKSSSPMIPLGQAPIVPRQPVATPDVDYKLGNGTILSLDNNEEIQVANPARPNPNFSSFIEALCGQIGTALGLPKEILLKMFTASYSASRAAILEAWKEFRMRREWLIHSFNRPIYEAFLSEAVALGRLECPGFFDDPAIRDLWCQASWTGPSQGQLDPLKEANAAEVRVKNNFSTREREAAEISGMRYDEIAARRLYEERTIPLPAILDPGAQITREIVKEDKLDVTTDKG